MVHWLNHTSTTCLENSLLVPVEHFLRTIIILLFLFMVDPRSNRLITCKQDRTGNQFEVNSFVVLGILQICFQSCLADWHINLQFSWCRFRFVIRHVLCDIVQEHRKACFFLGIFTRHLLDRFDLVVNLHHRLFFHGISLVINNFRGVGDDVFALIDVVVFFRAELIICRRICCHICYYLSWLFFKGFFFVFILFSLLASFFFTIISLPPSLCSSYCILIFSFFLSFYIGSSSSLYIFFLFLFLLF